MTTENFKSLVIIILALICAFLFWEGNRNLLQNSQSLTTVENLSPSIKLKVLEDERLALLKAENEALQKMEITEPMTISYEEAKKMIDERTNMMRKVLDSKVVDLPYSDIDSMERSVSYPFYSIEDKLIIPLVHWYGKDKRNFGLRIYFAKYPSDYKIKEYRGRQTAILHATIINDEGKYDDIVESEMPVKSNRTGSIDKPLLALNVGNLCPPSCPNEERYE